MDSVSTFSKASLNTYLVVFVCSGVPSKLNSLDSLISPDTALTSVKFIFPKLRFFKVFKEAPELNSSRVKGISFIVNVFDSFLTYPSRAGI
ncbi:MAG: hypothetical protein ACD_79C00467G0002 [uncultured bacterium]|nr:MAG: hypothetical protein ACD_79C00467G0002 [uncultured bacterium]